MGRVETYLAALVGEWYAERGGTAGAVEGRVDGAIPVFVTAGGDVAIAVAPLWEPEADPTAEETRARMEARLDAGNVHGPFLLWVPPRASVPAEEPAASDFVMRVQLAAAPVPPGGRNEVDLPVQLQMAKTRAEGGYASVVGGLGRFWTQITERVDGTFHVNSGQLRRASASAESRAALFDRIGELSRGLGVGDAIEFDTVESWTVQRLAAEPLGETGFAIVQAPPGVDPSDGTLMRRMVRKRLQSARDALASVDAREKGLALAGIYEYAEHENIGSFVKSVDPGLFAGLAFIVGVVDGEVRPVFAPR
jgi:hypothetical protein